VGALTAGALALRVYALSSIPPGFHGDEAAFGLEAQKIAQGDWLGVWTPVTLGHPTGHLYWTAFLFKLAGSSVFTVRLAMALLGAFTVPVAYLLFRRLFSPRVGFVTASLIAFSSWHLVYSRAGWTIVPALFLLLLSLHLFFLGRERGRWVILALGGVVLGLGFYTHKNFPFYYAGLWAFFLPRVFFGPSLRERRGAWLFLACSFIVGIPFFDFLVRHQGDFVARFELESFFRQPAFFTAHGLWEKALVMARRIGEVFLYLHNAVPRDFVDGAGERPLLDRATEAFFVLGLLAALVRLREPATQVVLIGLLAGFVPSMLVVGGEQRRLLGAMPFVMLCAALGLEAGLQLLRWLLNKLGQSLRQPAVAGGLRRGATSLGVAGFLAFFSFTNMTYYFNRWATEFPVKWVYGYDLVRAIDHLKTLDEDTHVYFYSNRWSYDYETRQFLLPTMRGEDRSDEFGGGTSLERRHQSPVVYVLLEGYFGLAPELQTRYPGGDYREARDSDGRLIFIAYRLGR
jgi:hypothetical protein